MVWSTRHVRGSTRDRSRRRCFAFILLVRQTDAAILECVRATSLPVVWAGPDKPILALISFVGILQNTQCFPLCEGAPGRPEVAAVACSSCTAAVPCSSTRRRTFSRALVPARFCRVLRGPAGSCEVLRGPAGSCGVLQGSARSCGGLRSPAGSCGAGFCGHLRGPAGACRVQRSPAESCGVLRVSAGSCGIVRCFAGSCGILPGFAGSCRVLRGPSGSCGILRGPTGSCGVLRCFAGLCEVMRGPAGSCGFWGVLQGPCFAEARLAVWKTIEMHRLIGKISS